MNNSSLSFRAMNLFLHLQSLSQSTKRRKKPSFNGNKQRLDRILYFCIRYAKTPMGKKRAKILEGDEEDKSKDKGKKK